MYVIYTCVCVNELWMNYLFGYFQCILLEVQKYIFVFFGWPFILIFIFLFTLTQFTLV